MSSHSFTPRLTLHDLRRLAATRKLAMLTCYDAGFAATLVTVILSSPGSTNPRAPLRLIEAWIACSSAASKARTSLAATFVASAR